MTRPDRVWQIEQVGFDLQAAQAFEGLFTLGSGYLHTRASLEEHFADCPQNSRELRKPANVTAEKFTPTPSRWGTFVPGVFGDHPLLLQEMINLPWFLELVPVVAGERLDVTRCDVAGFRRVLDMKTATLTRELTWRTRSGATLQVSHERFISGSRPHLSMQRMRVQSDASTEVTVRAGIDANVTTNGFDHYQSITLAADTAGKGVCCEVRTDRDETVYMESRPVASASDGWTYIGESRHSWFETTFHITPERPLVVEKRTAVATSRDPERVAPAQILKQAAGKTWSDLHAEHTEHWAAAWSGSDVEIDGDDQAQVILRSSIYHLLRAHVPNDSRVAIGAKGHAGEAYKGHFFWDTEVYLLPFYLYTAPEKAKTLVEFRVQALPEAKNLAASFGCSGARYPWESDADGRECCSGFQYSEHEIHVTADVVYGLAHYLAATGRIDNAPEAYARVAVETARYWLDRIDYRVGEDYPSILGVMGPDEYAPITHNNAYTNRLAAFNLGLAARLGERGGASPDEIAEFAKTAAALPIQRSAKSPELILQCEGFEQLAEPRFDQFWADRKGCYAARVSQERLYRSKNLKQADVLLLMVLFPDEFTDAEVKAAWDYYVPVTTHDSSLSAGIHALAALRLGLDQEAWDFFIQSAAIDLDTAHGGAAQGIHIAGCAANWQVVVYGFAGVKNALREEILSIAPRLPVHWRRLAFHMVWQGVPLRIEITVDACKVENRGDAEIPLRVWRHACSLGPGQTTTVATPGPDCLQGVIFDLDGVLVDSADCHYRAWQTIADRLGIAFDREQNHRLLGVSRRGSLLAMLNGRKTLSEEEMQEAMEAKNGLYARLIEEAGANLLLPGAKRLLAELRTTGIKVAVASSSRNAPRLLELAGLDRKFLDVVVSGQDIRNSKPDPEVFVLAAARLGLPASACIVVEDAPAGAEAARRAGMGVVGVGMAELGRCEMRVRDVDELSVEALRAEFDGNHSPREEKARHG